MEAVTAQLEQELDALVGMDPALLGDGETLVALHRQIERLKAVATRATAAFDASGQWQAVGGAGMAGW